jgi:aryl-alcohol dehydrogenase-like predicted oxidoreductase
MKYTRLGRTGVEVSRLCLGGMLFGRETGVDDSCRIIDRALDAGLNFLDTANAYGRGVSEEAVGVALKRNGRREDTFLATKVHGRMKDGDHQPNRFGNNRRMIIEECHHSLRRLQTGWIDLYQIHRTQSAVPIDETLRALDDLVRQGKVRYIGCSTFAAWQVVESLWVAKELGLNRFVTEQPPYHLLDRRIERELVPMAQTYGFAIIPWSPLAGGFLTGKYVRGEVSPAGARLGPRNGRGILDNDAAHDVVDTIRTLAAEKGCTVGQLALAWCAGQPGITSPIIGPRTIEQLEDNLGAVDVELDEQDRQKLDAVAPPGRATVPSYQADFGPHEHGWI